MNDRFKIEVNDTFGRYLVALKDLQQGEIILQEKAAVIGPQINAFPICFQCSTPLNPSFAICCENCKKALVCTPQCKGTLHNFQECNALKQTQLSQLDFIEKPQIIMVIRCLLMKQYDSAKWEEFMKLEAHLKERKDSEIWNFHKDQTEQILHQLQFISDADVEGNLIQSICGILDVNSFELRPPILSFDPNICLRGIFLNAALMAHECIANTHLAVDDKYALTIRASKSINKGDIIFFNYSNGFKGSEERRRHLKEGKYFDCMCKRCADTTELNTNLSAILCPQCRSGLVNSTAPLNSSNVKERWHCAGCNYSYTGNLIKTTLNLCKDLMEDCEYNLDKSEQILTKLVRNLSPQHYLIIDLKHKIIGMLKDSSNTLEMRRKVDLCEDLLPTLEILEPGISRNVGIINYELQQAKTHLANQEYSNKEIDMKGLMVKLGEAHDVLKKSVKLLLYEPKESPEGRLAQKAMNELQALRGTVNDLNEILKL